MLWRRMIDQKRGKHMNKEDNQKGVALPRVEE
jgi:hypothetical protein